MARKNKWRLVAKATRPLIAGIFIVGGLDSLRDPYSKKRAAEKVASPLFEPFGWDVDAASVVRVNGATQVGAGATLALGILPRLSALTLVGSLIPTTIGGHRFWEENDSGSRKAQLTQLMKNAAIFGGLLMEAAEHKKPARNGAEPEAKRADQEKQQHGESKSRKWLVPVALMAARRPTDQEKETADEKKSRKWLVPVALMAARQRIGHRRG